MEKTQILANLSFQQEAQEKGKIIKIVFSLEPTLPEHKGSAHQPLMLLMTNKMQNLSLTQDPSALNLNKRSIPTKKRKEKIPTRLK